MSILGRLMHSVRLGVSSAIAVWREQAFTPLDEDWNSWQDRSTRYQNGIVMYSNQQYKTSVNHMNPRMQKEQKLYRHIRSPYNPAYRTVEGNVSGVYGGELKRGLRGGSLHLESEDDAIREDIFRILEWSSWNQNKSLYVRTGAIYGDVFLKVIDDPFRQLTRLEIVDPRKIQDIEMDDIGNITRVVIQFEKYTSENNQEDFFTYTEIITPKLFETFKDGEPFAFFKDVNGEPRAKWENVYGFVPMTLVNHIDVGQIFGANSFHAEIGKINTVNDVASILNDSVRNAVDILYHAKGGTQGMGFATNSEEPSRDDIRLVYTASSVEMIPLVSPIDITGASQMIRDMLDEIESDIPILALHKIREGGNLTAPGVASAFSDAINQIKDAQANYDGGLIKALKQALFIAGLRGYNGIMARDFEAEEMMFTFRTREVIKDNLSKLERVQLLNALDPASPIASLVLEEMGFEPDAIEEAMRRAERTRQDDLMISMVQSRGIRLQELATQGRLLRDGRTETVTTDNGATIAN